MKLNVIKNSEALRNVLCMCLNTYITVKITIKKASNK